jgi:hypothetical protein
MNHVPKKGPYPFLRETLFVVLALLSAGCDQSPAEPFARLVEHVASWAAAARYAHQLNVNQEVPDAYVADLLKTGTRELEQLRTQLSKIKDIPTEQQTDAIDLTNDLQQLFDAQSADEAKLAALEAQLRELAGKVRRS